MITWLVIAGALAAGPELWAEGEAGAWRTTSCGCIDNVIAGGGVGTRVPLGGPVGLELGVNAANVFFSSTGGATVLSLRGGLHMRDDEARTSPTLAFGLSSTSFRRGRGTPHLGTWLRLGCRVQPGLLQPSRLQPSPLGGRLLIEPGLEWAGAQGPVPRSTLTASVRVGLSRYPSAPPALAPPPPPR